MKTIPLKVSTLLMVTLFLLCAHHAFALIEDDRMILGHLFGKESLVVSPTSYLKPLSQTAENITVISLEDIEKMNAHTVAEVLERVPGLQMEMYHAFGNLSATRIQGSEYRHVKVMIDGVTLDFLSTGAYSLGDIPVQHILRIEIIKGPASSTWGSALGGIINIITKSGWGLGEGTGELYTSYGERDTGDFRVDIAGEFGRFDYYLYVGKLQSDGFYPHTDHRQEHFYTKLRYELTPKLNMTFTLGYNNLRSSVGVIEFAGIKLDRYYRPIFSTLSFDFSIDKRTKLTVETRVLENENKDIDSDLTTSIRLQSYDLRDKTRSVTARFVKRYNSHTYLLGAEFDMMKLEYISQSRTRRQEKWAIFSNDTIALSRISITPGLRYEKSDDYGDIFAPSLGITYKLNKNTLFRILTARGFNTPTFAQTYETSNRSLPNPDLEAEKVWSYQAGMETQLYDFVWLKLTLFRHEIRDAIQWTKESLSGKRIYHNSDKERRQGFEVEARTIPVLNTSLHTAFSYVDAENRSTDDPINEAGGYTLDIGLNYETETITALLTGHYIWWDNTLAFYEGKYDDMIVDLTLKKRIYEDRDRGFELFFKGHNIFNGSLYLRGFYKNFRWMELGVRYGF